ncbi:unnamed protein product [Linum trigynum]|uniref:Uncharacterized protein n=1 Tax=Linum trigynum TaxID=586398 RepID=A0AAV2EE92_9ROSI
MDLMILAGLRGRRADGEADKACEGRGNEARLSVNRQNFAWLPEEAARSLRLPEKEGEEDGDEMGRRKGSLNWMSLRSPSTIDLMMQIGEERRYEQRWSEVATLLHSPSSKILAAASRRKKGEMEKSTTTTPGEKRKKEGCWL